MTNAKPVDSVEDFRNRVAENIRNAGKDRAFAHDYRGAGWISETNRTIVVISHIGCAAPL